MTAGDHPIGVFLHAKDTPYDIVFLERDVRPTIIAATSFPTSRRCCAPAIRLANSGGHSVEYGPGKHGVGHSYYVYLLDPDGHRTELLLPPIVHWMATTPPHVWDVMKARAPPKPGACRRANPGSPTAPLIGATVTHPQGGGGAGGRWRSICRSRSENCLNRDRQLRHCEKLLRRSNPVFPRCRIASLRS